MNSFQTIIFYAPLVVILFWGMTISVSISNERNHFKVPFLFFLLDAFIAILVGGFFHAGHVELYQVVYIPGVYISLSMFPLFHLFIISLTQEGGVVRGDYVRHLLFPLACMVFAFIVLILFGEADQRQRFVQEVLAKHQMDTPFLKFSFWMDKVLRMFFLISALLYFVLTERRIKRHQDAIVNYFSNTEEVGVNWYKSFRIVFSMTLLAGMIYYTLDRDQTVQNMYIPVISRLLLALFFWVLGYYVSRQKLIYVATATEEEGSIDITNEEIMKDLASALDDLMVKQKRFTDSSLTLPFLSLELGTNRTYLSRLFNSYLKVSFNAYINQKRVLYAKELLRDENCQVASVYIACGFKSTSNFYRVFSAIEGTTPMKYYKENKLTTERNAEQ